MLLEMLGEEVATCASTSMLGAGGTFWTAKAAHTLPDALVGVMLLSFTFGGGICDGGRTRLICSIFSDLLTEWPLLHVDATLSDHACLFFLADGAESSASSKMPSTIACVQMTLSWSVVSSRLKYSLRSCLWVLNLSLSDLSRSEMSASCLARRALVFSSNECCEESPTLKLA